MTLRAPFPWFGGKRRVAHLVWERFGDVPNFVEPFAGSLAVLLGRPHEPRCETVNDLDCYVANFWRCMEFAPELLAKCCDWPVNEADLHARHRWLVNQAEFRERMKSDPAFYDPKIAGWWAWGISQWIGSGWCSDSAAESSWAKRPRLGKCGTGVARRTPAKRPLLANNGGTGVHQKLPRLDRGGTGVDNRNPSRQMPDQHGDGGAFGKGVTASGLEDRGGLLPWFNALSARLRRVRVCCGDWTRILGPSPTIHIGTTAVFLDPPYADSAGRAANLYGVDSLTVAHAVREWALANGDNPGLRVALCGYEGEHAMPSAWECVPWKAQGGYAGAANGAGKDNCHRERIWFSPHCLKPAVVTDHQQTIEGVA